MSITNLINWTRSRTCMVLLAFAALPACNLIGQIVPEQANRTAWNLKSSSNPKTELNANPSILATTGFASKISSNARQDEATQEQMDAWITRFASGSYIERRVAMEKTFEQGKRAIGPLKKGVQSQNREIARRSKYILQLVELGIEPGTTRQRARMLMKFFSGSDSIKNQTLTTLLEEFEEPLDVLHLLSLTSADFQTEWIGENWSMEYAVRDLGRFERDRSTIEEILFHPVLWRNTTADCLYFANLLGQLENQLSKLSQSVHLEHADKKSRQQNLAVVSKLALMVGGLTRAEPFLAKLDGEQKKAILKTYLIARGDWRGVLKVTQSSEDGAESDNTDLQSLLLYRWLGQSAKYEELLDALIKKTDREQPAEVRALVDILVSNLEIERAKPILAQDNQAAAFQLLCYLNRYEEAYQLIAMGETSEDQIKWYREKTLDLRALNEELQQRFDRDGLERASQMFELLLNLAYYEGSLGNSKQSRRMFDLLADAEVDQHYRAQNRRTEMFNMILRLNDREFAWRFIEQRYPETELRMALSNVFSRSGDSTIAGFWLDLLKDEIKNPHDRLKMVASILRSPIAPDHEFDLDRYLELASNKIYHGKLSTRALALTYVAETLFKNGREEQAIQRLQESVECGKESSTYRLATYYFDREDWPNAAHWMRSNYETGNDELMRYLWLICQQKMGIKQDYESQRVRTLLYLAAQYGDGSVIFQLNRFREHKRLIRFLEERLAGDQFSLGNEYRLQNLIHSKSEWDPSLLGKEPQVMFFNIAARKSGSSNRLIYAEQVRNSEMSRIRSALQREEVELAWKLATNLCEFNPGDSQLAEDFVPLFEKAKRKDLADELFRKIADHYERLLKRYPNSALHHNNYAWICAKCNRRFELSLAHAKKATALRPGNSSYLDTLAEVHFLNGNREQAIELAEKCIQIDPSKIHYRRQLIRFKK